LFSAAAALKRGQLLVARSRQPTQRRPWQQQFRSWCDCLSLSVLEIEGDSLTSDNALQVARTGGQVADLADFLESVSSAARFFGIFSSDSSPLVTPTTSDRWCDIAIKDPKEG
jgi:hypothetical protein